MKLEVSHRRNSVTHHAYLRTKEVSKADVTTNLRGEVVIGSEVGAAIVACTRELAYDCIRVFITA